VSSLAYKLLAKIFPLSQHLDSLNTLNMLHALFCGSWINVLLVFVPAGFAVNYTHRNPVTVFCINFIAIIPSSSILSFAVENVETYGGDTLGALLNMTFKFVLPPNRNGATLHTGTDIFQ
jgi:hypothetical protein